MKCISLFKCNPQVEVIDKSHCSLDDVPNFQNYSRSLEELFLDYNRLTVLNDNVFKLTKLRKISISDNSIQDIPPDIAKLVNLVELDCSGNSIEVIPEQIKFLRGLQICNFSANIIKYLPVGLVQLKNLTCLNLSNNDISKLPEDIGLLKNLESLELRSNFLESLPSSICGLEGLKRFDIGQNLIAELPDDIGRLSNLEYLLIDENCLKTIPPDIGRLENLQWLDLVKQKEDGQKDYEDGIGGLEFLPEEIGGLSSLTDLHLSRNRLQSLPDGIRYLKNLTIFKVDKNYLSELNPSIGGCTSMQELVLTSNNITQLPSSIGSLTDLRSLHIDSNWLRDLPPQIGQLKNLGILSLRDNELTHLPNEIGQLELIKVLDVSGNRLEYLPISVASLNLKALWLSKNQAQPLPKLQIDELSNPRIKILTCYLLPQQIEENDDSLSDQSDAQAGTLGFMVDRGNRPAAVSFEPTAVDDAELGPNTPFVRHDTPHPRELKAMQHKLLNTTTKPELKGHDNASFVMADNNTQSQSYDRNNERHPDQPALASAYQHLEYESNGLPEVPFSTSPTKNQTNYVQTTSKLFEAFKQNNSDYPDKYDRSDHRNNQAVNENGHSNRNKSASREPSQSFNQSFDHNDNHHIDNDATCRVLDIAVRRSEHHKPGLGLSIAGGKDTPPFKDNDEGIFVSKVTRGGPAEAAGVKAGDKILAVNSYIFYDGITHQKAVEIFKKVKPDFKEFTIRVLRDPNDELLHGKQEEDNLVPNPDIMVTSSSKLVDKSTNNSTFTRTYTIPVKSESSGPSNSVNTLRQFLMKEPEKVKSTASTLPPGMSLLEGSLNKNIIYTTLVKDYKHDLGLVLENRNDDNDSRSTWSNIVIADIKPNSIASRDGKLQEDDRLLSINGTDVTGIDLDRIMLMLEGTERFIRIVVSRGDGDDPLGVALRNMPTRPSLGSWFSSTSNMSHRPSLIESYQRPTFGSVSSLQKHPTQLLGTKPPKPPKPSHLVSRDSETPDLTQSDENPIARPRARGAGASLHASQQSEGTQMSDVEKRAIWRRERLKSIEDDVEMAKLLAEAQRRRREEK